MSSSNGRSTPKSRRRSLFARTPLSALTAFSDGESDKEHGNIPRKKRSPSVMSTISTPLSDIGMTSFIPEGPYSPVRAPGQPRNAVARPPSLFGSFRSFRSAEEDEEPATASSSKAPSINWGEASEPTGRSKAVLHHGEVQTSSSMFRKKKEYLVLTETHLIRLKSYQKAADVFSSIAPPPGRAVNVRHSSMPSTGSSQETQSMASENSGDQTGGVSLKQIVAVYRADDGRPYFTMELAYLDDDTNHASSMTLQLANPEDRDLWLKAIRSAANRARLSDQNPVSPFNSHLAARAVEREQDYEPPNYAIYKVVQRPSSKAGNRSSSDDLWKTASTICFLAVGVHKIHLIPLSKHTYRDSSTPSLVTQNPQISYGIMCISAIKLSDTDDSFELTFRKPLEKPKTFHLASLASHDIALRIRHVDHHLRPGWQSRPYTFAVPPEVEPEAPNASSPERTDLSDSLDRTLIAYCIAYGTNPENISYRISYPFEDAPRFELIEPVDPKRSEYTALELLAVMRSLRYNESFGTISFFGIHLDALNGLHDEHGNEHLCSKTKRGTPVSLTVEELGRSCLLVQEIRALAITSKTLRRMDFTSCITRKPHDFILEKSKERDMGCGIVEALFPLCKHQTTNVDWISLNNIELGETDLDYLVAASVDRACHFRAIEMSRCGLNDRALSLILEALRAQENTLEAIDISGNVARLSPSTFEAQIGVFGFIRKLNLSNVSRTSGSEPLISSETLLSWRLEELQLSGTAINAQTVDSISSYLMSSQSETLRLLKLDHTSINGKDVSLFMHSMTRTPGTARNMHMDISQNPIGKNYRKLVTAIGDNLSPTHLTMRLIEYENEGHFRELVIAFTKNTGIKYLDISRASLPCDATEETSKALGRLFAENKTLEEVDISGEDSRLETSKLGVGINQALNGLKQNHTLKVLRIKYQKLGLRGASTLADVLKVNNTLVEVYCEHNDIPLSGFTDLVNSLHRNTTLQYLPSMEASHQVHLKMTEQEVKRLRDGPSLNPSTKVSTVRSIIASKVGNKSASPKPTTPSLSDQDINAALRLVDESWARQIYRLEQYLKRNHNLAHGIPTALDVDDEAFERPATASSLTKVIERVKIDSTPTREKEVQLGDGTEGGDHIDLNDEKEIER